MNIKMAVLATSCALFGASPAAAAVIVGKPGYTGGNIVVRSSSYITMNRDPDRLSSVKMDDSHLDWSNAIRTLVASSGVFGQDRPSVRADQDATARASFLDASSGEVTFSANAYVASDVAKGLAFTNNGQSFQYFFTTTSDMAIAIYGAFNSFDLKDCCDIAHVYLRPVGGEALIDWWTFDSKDAARRSWSANLSAGQSYELQLTSQSSGNGRGNAWVRGIGSASDSFSNSFRFAITESASVLPEPASWALMLLGFGAVGGALRRRPAWARATI